jgi:hypothetical protein
MFFTTDIISSYLKNIGFIIIEIIERESYLGAGYESRTACVYKKNKLTIIAPVNLLRINIMKLISVILLFLFIIGFYALKCNRNTNLIVNPTKYNTLFLNDTLNVTFKDTLFNYEKNIWLSFDSLITDSRCPIGVICVWEGNARVSLVFNAIRFNLNTHKSFTNDTTILNYQINLINVWPYPHIDSLYTNDQYSAEIIVNK